MVEAERNIPTIFTAFGATGDLMRLKVVPALFHLHRKGALPDMFRIIGFSRRDWTHEQYREYVRETLLGRTGDANAEVVDAFLARFQFQEGTFEKTESYQNLKKAFDALDAEWGVCANKLFYLAVAPEFYEVISQNLHDSRLSEPCSPGEGWTRVIVEKPFGVDTATAQRLDEFLGKLFKEEQIYRIDHYLAKEMLQNILTFRFANNLFEASWGKDLIESIHIKLLESIGVEKRGAFYDGIGAFRDVGQNHFLQIIALLTMERPASFEANALRAKRAEILERLSIIRPEEMRAHTFRAQYEGYRTISGVDPNSDTETYFKVRAQLEEERWNGVSIVLEGGKRLGEPLKEAVISFRHPTPCLCPLGMPHHRNGISIRMEPKEEILIEFWSKKPGLTMETERRTFDFLYRAPSARVQYTEEYEKLLLDCIHGDQTLFISTNEIRAMWRFVDPILYAWHTQIVPLEIYEPDTREVTERALV